MFHKKLTRFITSALTVCLVFGQTLAVSAQSLPTDEAAEGNVQQGMFLPLVATEAAAADSTVETTASDNTEEVVAATLYASYRIVAVHSGKCLDVVGGSLASQAAIQQYTCHGGPNQSWSKLSTSLGPSLGTNTLPFNILFVWHSQKCMDVVGGSLADQAQIQQYTCHGGPNQQWYVIPFGATGNHLIMAKSSGKCLDIPNGSLADGVRLQQSRCHGGANQLFRFQ